MLPELGNGPQTDEEILSSLNPEGAPAEPAAADPVDTFNPQEFGYKFRNETLYPKDRNELTELIQLGHSYRTNKPKWEQERQAYSAYEAKKDTYQRYDQLSAQLQANPEFRNKLELLAQEYSGQPKPAQAPVNPDLAPVLEKLNSFEQWKEQQETERADNDLKRELDDLEKANPSHDWKTDSGEGNLRKQLLTYMSENRVYNPKIALNAMMYEPDMQRARFDAERKAADDAAKARKAGVVAPGTGAAPAPNAAGFDPRKHSYDDLENLALESIRR